MSATQREGQCPVCGTPAAIISGICEVCARPPAPPVRSFVAPAAGTERRLRAGIIVQRGAGGRGDLRLRGEAVTLPWLRVLPWLRAFPEEPQHGA